MEDGELEDTSNSAWVEDENVKQNILIVPTRNKILIKTVGRKVLLKYVKNLLPEEEIMKIIDQAALMWCTTAPRRSGSGKV